jgi:hypothetical protein
MFQPCEWMRGQSRWGRHSSWLVIGFSGEFGGVAGPVATGVADPFDRGGGGEIEQLGEHGGRDLGGEVGHRRPPPGLGADAEGAEPFPQAGGRERAAGLQAAERWLRI